MKFLKLLLISVIFSHASYATNSNEFGPFSVSNLRIGPEGVAVRFSPAPKACGGGSQYRMHAVLSKDEVNYQALTSALLTAYTTGQKINYIFIRNAGTCSNTHALGLYMVEFRNKT